MVKEEEGHSRLREYHAEAKKATGAQGLLRALGSSLGLKHDLLGDEARSGAKPGRTANVP